MNIKQFLIENWYYIAALILALALFIVSIVRNKKQGKLNLWDSLKAAALENAPMWAVLCENLNTAEAKKNNFLSLAVAFATKYLGRNLTADENDLFIALMSDFLEKVLTAPQKKLIKAENTQRSKYTTR